MVNTKDVARREAPVDMSMKGSNRVSDGGSWTVEL
jgi:hypothetical protein